MADESAVEITVANKAEMAGWFQRKFQWVGRKGAPDRFFAKNGRVVLIEFKDPDEGEVRVLQAREIRKLYAAGVEVHVCDSVRDGLSILGIEE